MDVRPAQPLVQKVPSYLDVYKRRKQKSHYVKPPVEVIKRSARDYMDTFENFEPTFRPKKKPIYALESCEELFRRGRGVGCDLHCKAEHLTGPAIVTPNGEVWKRGKRYFIPFDGLEQAYRRGLRYIPEPVSPEFQWKPCIRLIDTTRSEPGWRPSRQYLHGPPDFGPEYIGMTPNGMPYLKPFKTYPWREPPKQLPYPDLKKKIRVPSYYKQHPPFELFGADFNDDSRRSGTRYIHGSNLDSFEDGKMTLMPNCVLPELIGSKPPPPGIPSHCPPPLEVRPLRNTYPEVIDIDMIETSPGDEDEQEKPRPYTVPSTLKEGREGPPVRPPQSPRFVTEYMRSYNRPHTARGKVRKWR